MTDPPLRPVRGLFDLRCRCRLGPREELWQCLACWAAGELAAGELAHYRRDWHGALQDLETYRLGDARTYSSPESRDWHFTAELNLAIGRWVELEDPEPCRS